MDRRSVNHVPRKFIPMKLDILFKMVFGSSKAILGDFLSAVVGSKVEVEEIINNELAKENLTEKKSILDVLASLEGGSKANIEVQLSSHNMFSERSLYYWSKLYGRQIPEGFDYSHLRKVICINIVDFNLQTNKDIVHYHTEFNIRREDGKLFSDHLSLHFLELPKLTESKEPVNRLELWLKFLNAESEEELKMISDKDSLLSDAYMERIKAFADEAKMHEIDARQKELMDSITSINHAKQEGKKEGKQEGKQEGRIEVVKEMYAGGMSIETIAKVLKQSEAEIRKYVNM
jgi:predicted transposase/invertase (TIGR01784 family)